MGIPQSALTLSVVIAAHNREIVLERCLGALNRSVIQPLECIVVDDGSTDGTAEVASKFGAQVVSIERRSGPALARNLGADLAQGDVILFLDSDVCVQEDTVGRIAQRFQENGDLDAVVGAYDDAPESATFWSQFRNLLHCYTHRAAKREARTFWSGCGAVRRATFWAVGGFDPSYERPAIEDIEFGARVTSEGRKILLDADIQVKHLKRWTCWNMIRTDVCDRGIPWARLILRSGSMPDDLNVRWSQRASVALVVWMIWFACLGRPFGSGLCFLLHVALNAPFYSFLWSRRGTLFTVQAIPAQLLFHGCCGAAFAVAWAEHLLLTAQQRLEAVQRPRFLE